MFETTKQFCLAAAQVSKATKTVTTPVPLMDVARQLTELTSIGPFRCYQKDLKGDDCHLRKYAHMLHGAGIFTYIWVIFRVNVCKCL